MKSCLDKILSRLVQHPVVVTAVVLVAVSIPAFFVLPSIDDWNTSRPIFEFDTRLLLPRRFWRPLEILMRRAAGLDTGIHLWIFHGVAVLGHAAGVLLLYRILRSVSGRSGPALAGALFFALSPATVAAVWSVDSAIQTCSTAFGLASLWLALQHPNRLGAVASIGCGFVATFWKESGIAWFVATPLFATALTDGVSQLPRIAYRKTLLRIVSGVCAVSLYFLCRAILATTDGLGAEAGRYAIHWEASVWLKNATLLAGVSSLQVDTLSLFGGGSRLVAMVSVLAGLPFTIWAVVRVLRSLKTPGTWLAIAATAAVIAPHIVLGRVSEMYAHPVVAALVLTVVAGAKSLRPLRSALPWLGLAMLVGVAVSAHKWSAMVQTGRSAEAVGEKILRHYGGPETIPERVCTVVVPSKQKSSYSVFKANPATASNWGRSVWAMTGWRFPKEIVSIRSVNDCPSGIKDVWQIDNSGAVVILTAAHQ